MVRRVSVVKDATQIGDGCDGRQLPCVLGTLWVSHEALESCGLRTAECGERRMDE